MTLFMTSYIQDRLENDVIITDIKSAGIHLLNYHSFRPTQPFLFLDQSTWQILPFVALAIYRYTLSLWSTKVTFLLGNTLLCTKNGNKFTNDQKDIALPSPLLVFLGIWNSKFMSIQSYYLLKYIYRNVSILEIKSF